MASRVGEKIKLTSIDELLCVPETNGTIEIELGLISAFENHPFRNRAEKQIRVVGRKVKM